MPIPTPFHTRTSALNVMQEWRDWAGFFAAGSYQPSYEVEYFAIRNAVALIDVSPLFKYEVSGPDAERLLDRVVTRNVARCAVGQVLYTPWCDDDGKVIDDGTVQRMAPDRFRVTSADPSLRWFQDCGAGMNAEVRDVSTDLAALALQGPRSRDVLEDLGVRLDELRYFHLLETKIRDIPVTVSRTGYTGDLGYELWIAPVDAEELWDALFASGSRHGLLPAGIAALDVARIEAGLLMIEVDYVSARFAVIDAHLSTPYELGLGWAVALDKPGFVGKRALDWSRERGSGGAAASPSRWRQMLGRRSARGVTAPKMLAGGHAEPSVVTVGLEVGWEAIEGVFAEVGLPPQVAGRAERAKIPIYGGGLGGGAIGRGVIGQATSLVFSPILKKYIAIAAVKPEYGPLGTEVQLEMTVEHYRRRVPAIVVEMPFYDPKRKRAMPASRTTAAGA